MNVRLAWIPLRPVLGGVAVVGLAGLFGRDYLGSLPLMDRALAGDRLSFWVFVLKIVFTAVTLGCGFPGGEVTPLFVIGATLGAALASPLGVDVAPLASLPCSLARRTPLWPARSWESNCFVATWRW